MTERWECVKGVWSEKYDVSNQGRVRRTKAGGRAIVGIMKMRLSNWGKYGQYYKISLSNNEAQRHVGVHQLVAETFIDNPECKPEVNHKNGNKLDNRVENLEWVTRSENEKHAFRIGLKVPACGSRHGHSKLTESDVKKIRSLENSMSRKEIADKFGMSYSGIEAILVRRTWKHI